MPEMQCKCLISQSIFLKPFRVPRSLNPIGTDADWQPPKILACSRRSDSGVQAKKKASERGTGWTDSLPSFFPALSFALFFARAPLSERLEQATKILGLPLVLRFATNSWNLSLRIFISKLP